MADSDGFVRITLRIPEDLHAKLTEAAAKKRSMNAEIIQRLESTFREVTITEEELDAAFSGKSPFQEAVERTAADLVATVMMKATDLMVRDGRIPNEDAPEIKASFDDLRTKLRNWDKPSSD